MNFITELVYQFQQNAATENAIQMSAYMKGKFSFYGLNRQQRVDILKPLWKKHATKISANYREIVLEMFTLPQRELHYCAMLILEKEGRKTYSLGDKHLIETLITTNSWWDTVDFLARNILGTYLEIFPEETDEVIAKFSASSNMWLNRSAILFQLGYKKKTKQLFLFGECEKHAQSKEFFIQKAIGWALREYAKSEPEAVMDFVNDTSLKPLSKREALKNFKLF